MINDGGFILSILITIVIGELGVIITQLNRIRKTKEEK
jgi:hypothetical protein